MKQKQYYKNLKVKTGRKQGCRLGGVQPGDMSVMKYVTRERERERQEYFERKGNFVIENA